VARVFAKAAGARIAVSSGSESDARDCVNTAPISSLIESTCRRPRAEWRRGRCGAGYWRRAKARGHRERFETAHHVAKGRFHRNNFGDYGSCCSAAVPSSWT
jgi:hypothetical protein